MALCTGFLTQFILLVLLGNSVVRSQDVSIDFRAAQTTAIELGSHILVTCIVTGPFNEHTTDTLLIVKHSGGKSTEIASEAGNNSDAPENVIFVGWYTEDDKQTLRLIIQNISRSDWGDYECKAVRQESVDVFKILSYQLITLDVLFPPSGNPICEALPSKTSWYDGDEMTLQCTSDAGNPPVSIQWYQSQGNALPRTQIRTSPENITATITFPLDMDFNGVVFNCIRTNNDLSLSNVSSCLIGPLVVFNKTASAAARLEAGEISGVVVVVVVVVLVIVVTVLVVRSGRCKTSRSTNDSEAVHMMQETKQIETGSQGKSTPVKHVSSADEGVTYAAVQKPKPPSDTVSSGRTSKVYPNAPAYPRPPKSPDVVQDEQYANSNIAYPTPKTETKDICPNSLAGSKAVKGTKSEVIVYSNTLDIGGVSKTYPYVNAEVISAGKCGKPRKPAPTEVPPSPPRTSRNSRELQYADLVINMSKEKPGGTPMATVPEDDPIV